ncbi:hypothetical protein L211DRAFT_852694 [Terfezia boudieri ATCC MYA-4762]|uniref:Uncharacterized protein n=1 Tax=Terfezia boudieri ATCC MYA-4762 TaxID=1051890 RepID=A0A3N4LE64_9PEZI|nr:hypothetical protein L211DRAFT_852694 [Terfezia boudieri ATCC MYA-4762]
MQACQLGLDVSIHTSPASKEGSHHWTGEEIKTEAIESSTSPPAPTQKETEAEIRCYEAETEAMIQKANTNPLLKMSELSAIARLVEAAKTKPSATRWSNRKIQ